MSSNKNHILSKEPMEPHENQYWEQLIENFSSHSKMWLEDFDTVKNKYQHSYFKKTIEFNQNELDSIKSFCSAKKIPLFGLINSAWALLLNRYTTSDDIIYGISPFSDDSEFKNINGIFPIIPVRSTIHENETIIKYINNLNKELRINIKKSSSYEYFFGKK